MESEGNIVVDDSEAQLREVKGDGLPDRSAVASDSSASTSAGQLVDQDVRAIIKPFYFKIVRTPLSTITTNGKFQVIQPKNWTLNTDYRIRWRFPSRVVGMRQYHIRAYNSRSDSLEDFAWLVRSIRCVHLAIPTERCRVYRELCRIRWKKCWAPTTLLRGACPNYDEQLEEAKKRYFALPPQQRKQLGKSAYIGHCRILASFPDPKDSRFIAHRVSRYAQVNYKGTPIDVIEAEWMETFEHCSQLCDNLELWQQLYHQRLRALSAMVITDGHLPLWHNTKQKCEEALQYFVGGPTPSFGE
jgi:hypothetical protein